ncbi:MAG: TonB family protein [Proteobacteria bacterium]|nr:TonB family protein [Pseudomonadota bacterium]MDA1057438.1 TonB family protein [Pseudomonadota bacterium]
MRPFGFAIGVSAAVHLTAAGAFLVGLPVPAPDAYPEVIVTDVVFETPRDEMSEASPAATAVSSTASNAAEVGERETAPEMAALGAVQHEAVETPSPLAPAAGVQPDETALKAPFAESIPEPAFDSVVPGPREPDAGSSAVLDQVALLPVDAASAAEPSSEEEPEWTGIVPRVKPLPPLPRQETAVVAETNLPDASVAGPFGPVDTLQIDEMVSRVDDQPVHPQAETRNAERVDEIAMVAPNDDASIPPGQTTAPPRHADPSFGNGPPKYPYAARRRGMQGRVLIEVRVDREGEVREALLASSSGYRILDRAALEAVRHWTFAPARRGDRPVESTITVPIVFKLEQDAVVAQDQPRDIADGDGGGPRR